MKKTFLMLFSFLFIILTLFFITGCKRDNESSKINIVTTNFPSYDFARAITKGVKDINVKMIVKPGTEIHHYEPSPKDIINIKNSDLFIYVGGDSDEWIDDVLKSIDTKKTKVVKLIDLVNVVEEELIDGMEEDDEGKDEEEKKYDEHVWTSPKNAITILNKLNDIIIKINPSNSSYFNNNTNSYIEKISKIDQKINNIVNTSKRKTLIFGDRFPLRYFVDEYNLSYYAAFKGCSEETEASAKTIAFLIDKVKKDNIPVVFHIELSNGKIAKEIANETNAKVLEFNSIHNITQDDFDKGITYIDLMKKNIKVLKEALN